MKKLIVLLVLSFLLISFVSAIGITGSAVNNNTDDKGNQIQAQVGVVDDESETNGIQTETQTQNAGEEETLRNRVRTQLNSSQIKEIVQEKNRIKAELKDGECPESCTCTGSVVKCTLADGTREMTITAGKSGNVIIQVKGVNASTEVTLYKTKNGTLYAVTKNNETKEIKMFPNQVKEKLREKTAKVLEDENIILDEDGNYQYEGKKRARLFNLFRIRVRVTAEINAETGEIIKTSKPKWWEFLAKDEEDLVVGASCGTVTPGYNDACCQDKGYDLWNAEIAECVFSE